MLIYSFFSSPHSYHGFFITKSGSVYCFGNNVRGQLGIGDKMDRIKPVELNFFKQIPLSHISCGNCHSLFLTRSKKVYGVGKNDFGNLGVGDNINKLIPVPIPFFNDHLIKKVSCGGNHSLFLNNKNEIFGVGDNDYGQIGSTNLEDTNTIPIQIYFVESIESFDCGFKFSVFLSFSKKIYVCGENDKGQLGINNQTNQPTPVLISSFSNKKIIQFSCGVDHCLFMDEKRNIYGTGKNHVGQLGINNKINQLKPILISSFRDKNIIRIQSGGYFSLFLTKENKLYGCGRSGNGELGQGKKLYYKSPILLNYYKNRNFIDFSTGCNQSYFYSKKNEIFGCGSNEYGSLFNLPSIKKRNFDVKLLTNKFNLSVDINHEKRVRKFKFKFSNDTKLLNNEKFYFIFPNGKKEFINCSYASFSPIIKELISKNEFSIELKNNEREGYLFIKKFLICGKINDYENISQLKSIYFLSKKLFLVNLNYILLQKLGKSLSLIKIIDLLIELSEENKEESSLFLQCKLILKKKHSKLLDDNLDYLSMLNKSITIDSTKGLLCLVIAGFPKQDFISLKEHEEFRNKLNEDYSYKNQIYSLINEDLTKNLAFLTLDKQVMKVHKEIMIKHPYYEAMLTNPIWEESQKTIIEVNLSSKYLIPFIIYIYSGDVNFSNLEKEDFYTFSFYCKKFLFKEIQLKCDEEIERNNSILSSEIVKFYELLSNSEIERGEEQFSNQLEIRQLKSEIKEVQREIKEVKIENKEIKKDYVQKVDNIEKEVEEIKKIFEESTRKRKREEYEEENEKKKRKL